MRFIFLLFLFVNTSLLSGQPQIIDQKALRDIYENNKQAYKKGKVADYIPELKKADPSGLALTVIDPEGNIISVGDTNVKFTMQSISKIITLHLAVLEHGEAKVFENMGYFGTHQPFNHFSNLETDFKPLNPMMNAGAIYTTSLISDKKGKPIEQILEMIRFITKNESININQEVYLSEKDTGHRNRGMFYLMKNAEIIKQEDEQPLDTYFKQCSIELTTEDLAKIAYFYAHFGIRFDGNNKYENKETGKLILSQMLIAGMYDSSGLYAREVGIPSKSGVGGGIIGSIPNKYGIAAFSPALDTHGNSVAGYQILKEISKLIQGSVFE